MTKGFQGSRNNQTGCPHICENKDNVTVKIGEHIFKLKKEGLLKKHNLNGLKREEQHFFRNLKIHLASRQHGFEEVNKNIFQAFILQCDCYLKAVAKISSFEEFSVMEEQRAMLLTTITDIIRSEEIIANSRRDTEISFSTGIY